MTCLHLYRQKVRVRVNPDWSNRPLTELTQRASWRGLNLRSDRLRQERCPLLKHGHVSLAHIRKH